jgi:iron complex transport system permease protein
MILRSRFPAVMGYGLSLSALCAAVLCGLYVGDIHVAAGELFKIISDAKSAFIDEPIKANLIWRIRVPRVIAAAMSGAILASCGVIFQAVLRNPLSEPYTLGVASGASFGASVAILIGSRWITPYAFMGSAAALAAVMALGARDGEDEISGIILAGVIVGSIMTAGQTLIRAIAGDKLSAMVLWLMGSFSASGGGDLRILALSFLVTVLMCVSFVPELDIMSSGNDGAHLGVNIARARVVLLAGASLAVSIVVSRFGVIGFVGLVAPHIFRIMFGPSHGVLLPLSSLGGAALLVAADTLAKRWNELPVGVLTVLIGGPVFCFILWKRKN